MSSPHPFGTQIRFALQTLRNRKRPLDLGEPTPGVDATTKLALQMVVSALVLIVGLVLLVQPDTSPGAQQAATGWIGAVLGYWLR